VRERSFTDLAAYKRAVELADEIYRAVGSWGSFDRWTVGVQLVRAADSVGANIAEATGRWHYADQIKLLLVARGSLYETRHWLDRGRTRGLIDATCYQRRIEEIARPLNGLIGRRRALRAAPPIPGT
jgi:four helix bundle protein